jgi:iron complex outermembrane receptor protein
MFHHPKPPAYRPIRLSSMVALAVFASLEATPLQAQMLEEVTVTASRRAESLQDSGSTVTAFTADSLASRSIHQLEDIGPSVPGLDIAAYQSETSIFIRGIGTPAIIAGNDNSVATYVDGVFYSRAAAVGPAFFDIERVEVLRGPQGTLYGRNATGGAVNIITRGPSDQLEADVQVSYGNYDAVRLLGAVGGPLGPGVRGRLAVQHEQRDGYTDVIQATPGGGNTTDDVEDRDTLSLRARLAIDLGETATVTLTGDYFKQDDQSAVFHYASAGYAEEVPGWYQTREGLATAAYFAWKQQGRASKPGSRTLYADAPYSNDTEIWGATAQLDWALGRYDLRLIANHKSTEPSLSNEFDLSDAFVNRYQRAEDHEQSSIDFQLSSPASSSFSWILGGYYFEEENIITNNIFGDFWEPVLIQGLLDLQAAGVIPVFPVEFPSSTLCCDLHLNGAQESEAWAFYLDTTWQITDSLSLSLGGRYSDEERDGRQDFELLSGSPAGGADVRVAPNVLLFPDAVSDSRDGVVADPFGFVVAPVEGPADFDAFTPKFGLEWQASDDVLLYASIQKGFKSGGYNIGSSQRTPFKPETIWGYEVGLKSTLADGAMTLNGAVFHYDYENLQAQDSVQNQPIIRNVGEAVVDGVEFELTALLGEHLLLDASATWLDARFTEGTLSEPLRPAPESQPPGTLLRDLDGLALPRAPEWKFNLGVQSDWRLPSADTVSLRVDYSWQSEIYFTVFNIDAASQGDYGLFNARAEYRYRDGKWSLALFGRNLGDEAYFSNQILTGTFYGAEFVGSLGAPRTYGLEFRYQL